MNIKIICIGKLKEQYLRDACNEYIKRISRFAAVDVRELSEYRLPDNPSQAETEKAKAQESAAILNAISKNDYVYALDVGAKQLTSEAFSVNLTEKLSQGYSSIVFVIGGSNGYTDDVRKRADCRLGFSEMTFPHQLFRVMLLEQVYRAFKICAGEKYHK